MSTVAHQAEMKYGGSTLILLSFSDEAKLGLAQIIPLKEDLVHLYLCDNECFLWEAPFVVSTFPSLGNL